MRGRHQRIHTIYDKMEMDGVFEANPANRGARDAQGRPLYKGPVKLPAMVYHPEGAYKITTPAEPIATPFGAKLVGEQRQLINKIAHTREDFDALVAEGWHVKPADATARNPEKLTEAEMAAKALPGAPLAGSIELTLAAKDREIADLKKKLEEAEAE